MIAQTCTAAAKSSERVLLAPLLSQLGVQHGFTTRVGGVSQGRYSSLNLGETWGDDPTSSAENLRLVANEGRFGTELLCQVRQVHSADVVTLDAVEKRVRAADGMATDAQLVLGVYSADCVCILLADSAGRVAAVHAGWRGTVAGIAQRAVEALQGLGAAASDVRAALGPSIGPCCFEVKEDVAAPFRAIAKDAVRQGANGSIHVDLWRTNRQFLEAAGVPAEHIADAPPCTRCDPQRFFSYRRDGAQIGQHLAFIVGGGPCRV